MRRAVQKNKNKQKQELKSSKIKRHVSLYSADYSYMNITAVHLTDAPIELEIKVPYNFILREINGLSNNEITYLCRASDLLVLTVNGSEINNDLISLVKRLMPTAIIVYAKKYKNIAKAISKSFGDAKTCELRMMNTILEKIETENTHMAKVRSFMIPSEHFYEDGYLYVKGFMKNGLRSDKVVINGIHEGIIEEVRLNGQVLEGKALNFEESEVQLNSPSGGEEAEKQDSCSYSEHESENEESEEQDLIEEYEACDLNPDFDLINKYADFRGIKSLASCTFKDQEIPDHYRNIVFFKSHKYIMSQVKAKPSIVPKNSEVTLKIFLFNPIVTNVLVIFNLMEYETRMTIHNFDFSSTKPMPKNIVVDNGFRVTQANCIVTRNLNNNVFEEEAELVNGVVSFIGPIDMLGTTAHVLNGNIDSLDTVKLLNGKAHDRLFFERAELRGKPIKIYKSHIVVKGMFFNKEQVDYFRNIKIEAKNGITGYIKKSLGTKGLFKAFFAQPVKHGDIIAMPLYKRKFL